MSHPEIPEGPVCLLVRSMVGTKRWEHSLRTADMAQELAHKFHQPYQGLRIAALTHDLAREQDAETIKIWASQDQSPLPGYAVESPVLQHGFAAAWYLAEFMNIQDQSILNAVRHHTTGHPQMDDLGLILFAADYLEPGRRHLENRVREALLSMDLYPMVMEILDQMEHYLASRGICSAPPSGELYESLKKRYNTSS